MHSQPQALTVRSAIRQRDDVASLEETQATALAARLPVCFTVSTLQKARTSLQNTERILFFRGQKTKER